MKEPVNSESSWYAIGFQDGEYNTNLDEWEFFSNLKPGYKAGLKKGRKQYKRNQLIKLLHKQNGT